MLATCFSVIHEQKQEKLPPAAKLCENKNKKWQQGFGNKLSSFFSF